MLKRVFSGGTVAPIFRLLGFALPVLLLFRALRRSLGNQRMPPVKRSNQPACGACGKSCTQELPLYECYVCGRSICSNCSSSRNEEAEEAKRQCKSYCQATALGEDFKLPQLTDRSREFLLNVACLVRSKLVVDATAEKVLPRKWMEKHIDFAYAEQMIQMNKKGKKVSGLDELYEVAELAKPKFAELMRALVRQSELNPDEEIKVDGKTLMLDEETPLKVLTVARLKSRKRCREKAANEYDYDYSRLVDVVRCSIVVYNEGQLDAIARKLSRDIVHYGYVVVRLKNRFKHPLFNSYRDALYSIAIDCGDGVTHVCEVQVHLAVIIAHKQENHKCYEYFRTYFNGSKAEEVRMKELLKIGEFDLSPDRMLASLLGGCDVARLELLGDLLGKLMGDVQMTLLVRERVLTLHSSLESIISYAEALSAAGQQGTAKAVFQELLVAARNNFGSSHPHTLRSMNNLAVLLRDQGELKKAEDLLHEVLNESRQQFGNSHRDTLLSMNNLARLLSDQSKYSEAEPLFREVLEERRKLPQPNLDTLLSINNLAELLSLQANYSAAEPLFREALKGYQEQLGRFHPSTLSTSNNFAALLQAQGKLVEAEKLSEAEKLFRETLSVFREQCGESHPNTLMATNNLAVLLKDQGQLDEAATLFRDALNGYRDQLGSSNPATLTSINNLASVLKVQGKLAEAEVLFLEALEARRRNLGDMHLDTLMSINNLAGLLRAQGKFAEAEKMYREVMDARKQQLGDSHPETLVSMNNLAMLLKDEGKLAAAEPMLREVLSGFKQLLISHPLTLNAMNNLASLLHAKGNHKEAGLKEAEPKTELEEAELLYREALNARRVVLGNTHYDTLASINNLGVLLKDRSKLTEAEPLLHEALKGYRNQFGGSHPSTLAAINNLAGLYEKQGKLTEAELMYREALSGRREQLGDLHPETLLSINNLAWFLQTQGKCQDAEDLFREALNGRRKQLGSSHPDTLMSMSNLASVLKERGKLVEAEPLFREALKGCQDQFGASHASTLAALDNLAGLLEEEGKYAEASLLRSSERK